MIIKKDEAGYDGSFRLVVYGKDTEGRTVAKRVKSDMDDQIASFYDQRRSELERLEAELVARKISPVSLFMQYENMTIPDLAKRMKLSKRKLKKHLTFEGFKEVTVAQLQAYARIFDIALSDFFQFLHLEADVAVETRNECDRIVQIVEMKPERDE